MPNVDNKNDKKKIDRKDKIKLDNFMYVFFI